MTDTTTIEINDDQRQTLGDLKVANSESNKDVLQRLIDDYNNPNELTENRVRELAREEIADRVVREALE